MPRVSLSFSFSLLPIDMDPIKFINSLEENKDVNQDTLVEATRSFIAGYKLPKKIIFVDRVERAPNGKANYKWAKNIANESYK